MSKSEVASEVERILNTIDKYRPFDYKAVKNLLELLNLAYTKVIEARERNSSVMLISNMAILIDIIDQSREAETYWLSQVKERLINVDITEEEINRFKVLHKEYFELMNITRELPAHKPVRFRGKFLTPRRREKRINLLTSKLSRLSLEFSQRLAPLMKLQTTLYQRETIIKGTGLTIKAYSESETALNPSK